MIGPSSATWSANGRVSLWKQQRRTDATADGPEDDDREKALGGRHCASANGISQQAE
jgi:hypothetical protein